MTFRLSSILPFVIALLVGACSLLPSDASDSEVNADLIPFETLRKEYIASLTDSTGYATEPETFVLRSEANEEAFLANYPQDTLPEVDYSEQIVAGVLAGARSNTSYEVIIDSVSVGAKVVVHATESGSGAGGRAITHPAHIAALNRSDVAAREIMFAEVERVCEVSPCIWEQ